MPDFITRDAGNNVIFRMSENIVRLYGNISINSGNTSGSLYLPDAMGGTPMYMAFFADSPDIYGFMARTITISGRTISWSGLDPGSYLTVGVS